MGHETWEAEHPVSRRTSHVPCRTSHVSRRKSGVIGLALVSLIALFAPGRVSAQENPFGDCKNPVPILSAGRFPELIEGRPGATRYTLIGSKDVPVIIKCDDLQLTADRVVMETDTRDIHATGQVLLVQPDLQIYADQADLNGKTRFGTFVNARGQARVGEPSAEMDRFGSNDPDVYFSGEKITKIGPRSYKIEHGRFTTCVQATSRWEMTQSSGTLDLDKHVLLKNMVLRVKNVPLFYLPVLYYPIDKEGRSTGFLMPSYGNSTVGGTSFSNAFFWAISRWQDLTLYHDWFAKTGQGMGPEYRYIRSADSQGNARFYIRDEKLGGTAETPASTLRSYNVTGNVNQGLGHGIRFLGNLNYFTQISTQQLYQGVNDYSTQQRSFSGSLTGSHGPVQFTAVAEQREYFAGFDQGARTGRLPWVNVRMADKPVGGPRLYIGASAEGAYLVAREDTNDPTTDQSLWRFHGGPTVRAIVSNLPYLNVTTNATWTMTQWLESRDPTTGLQEQTPLTRQLLQTSIGVTGPTFSRIFQTPGNGYADRFKHIISPTFSIDRTSSFREYNRVVQTDSIDTQVGGVTTINYGLRNQVLARLAAKPVEPGGPVRPAVAREILSVNIAQSYYSNTTASLYDPNYQSASGMPSESNFSALRLEANFKPVDSTTATFRMDVHPRYRQVQSLSARAMIDGSLARISADWYRQLVIPQLSGYSADFASQSLNANVNLRTRRNHVGGTYTVNYDLKKGEFVNQRVSGYYNTQCCGLNFDYQKRATPLLSDRGIPQNQSFSVSFSLAGVGSFSNPMGSFGGR